MSAKKEPKGGDRSVMYVNCQERIRGRRPRKGR